MFSPMYCMFLFVIKFSEDFFPLSIKCFKNKTMHFKHLYNVHEIPLTCLQSIRIRLYIEKKRDWSYTLVLKFNYFFLLDTHVSVYSHLQNFVTLWQFADNKSIRGSILWHMKRARISVLRFLCLWEVDNELS